MKISGLKNILPYSLRRSLWYLYSGLLDVQWREDGFSVPTGLGWLIHPRAFVSRHRLSKFKNSHEGERCFIIGNGPSLKKTDLSLLRDEATFGLNRIYLVFPKIGFHTTYYVSVNGLVIEQSAREIEDLTMPIFLSWNARRFIDFGSKTIFIRDPYDGTQFFSKNPACKIWEGATVTYVAMQLAYYMGFNQVVLIGVDHSFSTVGEANKVITSGGIDQDHFDPNYFGKGFRWQLPDLELSEKAYRLAKLNFEREGRVILDATVGGKLDVFPKVDYESLF